MCLPPSGSFSPGWEDEDVDDRVEAAGFLGVLVGAVHLALVTGAGPVLVLVFGVDVDAAVGAGCGLDLALNSKFLKEPCRPGPCRTGGPAAADLDLAFSTVEDAGRLVVGLPAGEVLPLNREIQPSSAEAAALRARVARRERSVSFMGG